MKKIYLSFIVIVFIFTTATAQWTQSGTSGNYYLNSGQVAIGTTPISTSMLTLAAGGTNVTFTGLGSQNGAITFDGSSNNRGTAIIFPNASSSIYNYGAANEILAFSSNGTHQFLINSAEIMRVNANGVGVGTNSPLAMFHVNSNASSSNTTSQYSGNSIIQASTTSGRSSTLGASLEFVIPASLDGTNAWGQARIIAVAGNSNNTDATGKLILGTRRLFDKGTGTGFTWNYGDDLVIDGVGDIGIGTGSPNGYKLAVKGNVHAQQVSVDLTGWSDFVFNKAYVLPPLWLVKNYIDQNHHLPDMPSEKEVIKDGINLGEMNKLLTEKVEELTLYLIEKDAELKAQEKISRKQEDRLKKIEARLNGLTMVKKN